MQGQCLIPDVSYDCPSVPANIAGRIVEYVSRPGGCLVPIPGLQDLFLCADLSQNYVDPYFLDTWVQERHHIIRYSKRNKFWQIRSDFCTYLRCACSRLCTYGTYWILPVSGLYKFLLQLVDDSAHIQRGDGIAFDCCSRLGSVNNYSNILSRLEKFIWIVLCSWVHLSAT